MKSPLQHPRVADAGRGSQTPPGKWDGDKRAIAMLEIGV